MLCQVPIEFNLLVFFKAYIFFYYHTEETMQNQGLSPTIKIEQPAISYEMSQNVLNSQFIFKRPLLNQQQFLPHNREINNPPPPIKRRRNGGLKLKNQPSEQKMRKIDEKRGKYKRSTNNSHKKYTAVARRLLLKYLSERDIKRFQTVYESLKNSRTYYFIILAHVKYLLRSDQISEFQGHFLMLLNNKMGFYRKQIQKTSNRNFINFRMAQIAEIKYAIKAFNLYFDNQVESAVEVIYKKNKNIIIKKSQYEQTIEIIQNLEEQLKERTNHQINHKDNRVQQTNKMTGFRSAGIHHRSSRYLIDSPAEQSQHRSSLHQSSKHNRSIDKDKVYPLAGLQHSYPYFESFYPIMFPYNDETYPQPISLNLINSQLQFQLLEQQLKEKEAQPLYIDNQSIFTKFKSFQDQPFIITPHPNFQHEQNSKQQSQINENIS